MGIGLEYKESKFGLSNNYYKALSGKKAYGPSGINEEALDGIDLIASGFVPQFNWIETELSLGYWDSVAASSLNEVKLGFNFNITDFLTVNIEAEDDNKNTISYNAGINFNIGGNKSHKPSLLGSYQSAP